MKVVLVFGLCLSAALCRPQYPKETPKVPANLYEVPAADYVPDSSIPQESRVPLVPAPKSSGMGMPYDLDWVVSDADSGNVFSHKEASSDGIISQGEYSVLLPDGRTQVVKFTVKGDEGYRAQVTYVK